MKAEIEYHRYSHSKPSVIETGGLGRSMEAIYQHPMGFARLYSETYTSGQYSSIDFIWQGAWHTWTIRKRHTATGLARKAFHLINELTGHNPN